MTAFFHTAHIELLMKHELAMSALYQVFSRRLPKFAFFWDQFVVEENAHADVLRRLAELLNAGKVGFQRPAGGMTAVEESLEWVLGVLRNLSGQEVTMHHALDMACRMERTLLEQNFFAIFSGDDPEIQREFAALAKHSQAHLHRVLEAQKEHAFRHPLQNAVSAAD